MAYFLTRLREPSTYAGLAALVGAFGITVPLPWVQAASALGTGIAAVLAVALPEHKAPD